MNIAVGKNRKNHFNILRLCLLYPLSPCSCSLLVSLIMSLTPPSNETLSLNLFSCRRSKSQQVLWPYLLIFLYSFCLSLINPSTQSFPSNSSHRPFFPKFISALMDILSTGGFWFRLLMLSASPNIHFGRSTPSHWFLWRWNSDWIDLSWRPRAPTCLAPLQHMKEDAPYRLSGERREASDPVHLILFDLFIIMTLMLN